jgi:serine/threonine protein kinase
MLQPGDVVAETYVVERLLGSGGMAHVYGVKHLRMPRKFALKVLQIQAATRGDFLERFEREAEILATLRHPHIVDVIDRNKLADGDPYIVMELLEGEDLATFIARSGALSVPVALRILSQIGEALEAAHRVGITHRDLKPSNIFLCTHGQVLNFVKGARLWDCQDDDRFDHGNASVLGTRAALRDACRDGWPRRSVLCWRGLVPAACRLSSFRWTDCGQHPPFACHRDSSSTSEDCSSSAPASGPADAQKDCQGTLLQR